jgi:TIR domain
VADGYENLPEPKTFEVELGMSPWSLTDTVTCLDVVAGRSISLKSRVLAQTATYLFEPTSKGTMVTALHMPWGAAALSPLMAFVRPWAEHTINQALLQLKQRLEALRHRPSPPRIFFSYRRKEDRYAGGRVCEWLMREFGEGTVFRDVESISSGDFAERIRTALRQCEVVVPFIGPGWFEGFREKARLGRKDWVLEEIKVALELKPAEAILPVLVEGAIPNRTEPTAKTPKTSEKPTPASSLEEEIGGLPEEIRGLGNLQIQRLRPDPDFRTDMDRLVKNVWKVYSESETWRASASR